MRSKRKRLLFLTVSLLLVSDCFSLLSADERHEEKADRRAFGIDNHEDNDHNDGHKRRTRNRGDTLGPIPNPVYKENCGACHLSYQPQFLPSGSWEKILSTLDDHFGETVGIDTDSRETIREYLLANAAERSPGKRSKKIMRSLGQRTPLRITEIPYIREKHHEISQDVFSRPSIVSFSNCVACHVTAENGIYNDDQVRIPR